MHLSVYMPHQMTPRQADVYRRSVSRPRTLGGTGLGSQYRVGVPKFIDEGGKRCREDSRELKGCIYAVAVVSLLWFLFSGFVMATPWGTARVTAIPPAIKFIHEDE